MEQTCYSIYTQAFMKKIRYSVIQLFRYSIIPLFNYSVIQFSYGTSQNKITRTGTYK